MLRTGEANPSTVPAEPNAGSGCGQQVGVAVPEEAQGGMHRRREASPTRSAQLTDKVNRGARLNKKGRPEAEEVLRSLPVYLLTTHRPPMWLLRWFDQRARAWFWCGENKCNGGNCRIRWDVVCRPKLLGGLGLQDNKLNGALCLRRLWLRWASSHLPNLGLLDPCDDDDFAMFATTSRVTTGKW